MVKFPEQSTAHAGACKRVAGSQHAVAAGLTAPEDELVEVSSWLMENTDELEIVLGRTRENAAAGLQFGSRFVGGLMPGQVVDYLAEEHGGGEESGRVCRYFRNRQMDGKFEWTSGSFTRKQRERRYRAVFIDFGYCFHAGEWRFEDAPLRGVYYRNDVYARFTDRSLRAWLTRMRDGWETVWAAANEVPPEWYGGDLGEMEPWLKSCWRGAGDPRMIEGSRESDRKPFPKWGREGEIGGGRIEGDPGD